MRQLIWILALVGVLTAGQFKVMTEDLPPHNFMEDGKLVGISVEVVEKIMQKLGYQNEKIEVYPWARALHLLDKNSHAILFTTTYTKERAKKYKFVCPIGFVRAYFYKKKGRSLKIDSLEDTKKVERIGVVSNFAVHQELIKLGFTNLDVSSLWESVFKKVMTERIDLFVIEPQELEANSGGFPVEAFENTGVSLYRNETCIAFNPAFSDEEIAKWQKELNRIHESGEYDAIYEKYLSNPR